MSRRHLEDALQAGQRISSSPGSTSAVSGSRATSGGSSGKSTATLRLEAGPSLAGGPEDEGVFALRFVDRGRRLVLGTGAEGIRCLEAASFKGGDEAKILAEATTMKQNQPIGGLAIACLAGIRGHDDVILAASTSGYVYKAEWNHPGFSTVITERGNHLTALDTTEDFLATVGSDCCVRIYDARTFQPVRMYASTRDLDPDCPEGHATRLFAVRFNTDGQLLLTAGWDGCVKFWDPRRASSDPVKRLSGPHICSPDGLDVKGDRVLTGSYRPGAALQLWDSRQCDRPLAEWPEDHVYCAKFTTGGTVTAAGALSRCVTVWDANTATAAAAAGASTRESPDSAAAQPAGRLELDSSAYCLAVADDVSRGATAATNSSNSSSSSAYMRLAIGCHSGRLQLARLR